MRGISLVRTLKEYPEPNRKEYVLVKHEFKVRCNAAIPLTHKAFRNQYLPENYEAPKLPPLAKKKPAKKNDPGKEKLQKHKTNYAA